MTFLLSALTSCVYCIVSRNRLTDVATMAVIEWETLNGGETEIVYYTEEVCMASKKPLEDPC